MPTWNETIIEPTSPNLPRVRVGLDLRRVDENTHLWCVSVTTVTAVNVVIDPEHTAALCEAICVQAAEAQRRNNLLRNPATFDKDLSLAGFKTFRRRMSEAFPGVQFTRAMSGAGTVCLVVNDGQYVVEHTLFFSEIADNHDGLRPLQPEGFWDSVVETIRQKLAAARAAQEAANATPTISAVETVLTAARTQLELENAAPPSAAEQYDGNDGGPDFVSQHLLDQAAAGAATGDQG